MIDLYTWTMLTAARFSIALEEFELPYAAHAVDIGKGEQFKLEFLKISPNNRIPAYHRPHQRYQPNGVRRHPDVSRR